MFLFVFFRKIIHEEDDVLASGDRLIQKIRALEPIDHCLFYIICLLLKLQIVRLEQLAKHMRVNV